MRGYKMLYTGYSAVEEIQKGKKVFVLWIDETGNPRVSMVNDLEVALFAAIINSNSFELWSKEEDEPALYINGEEVEA